MSTVNATELQVYFTTPVKAVAGMRGRGGEGGEGGERNEGERVRG